MFPRAQRLGATQSILAALRRGERVCRGVVCCYFLAKPGTVGKVTVIVDTKVSKKAVERNLVKRRVRAILKSLGLPKGDLVVRLQRGATEQSYEELHRLVSQCLQRLVH